MKRLIKLIKQSIKNLEIPKDKYLQSNERRHWMTSERMAEIARDASNSEEIPTVGSGNSSQISSSVLEYLAKPEAKRVAEVSTHFDRPSDKAIEMLTAMCKAAEQEIAMHHAAGRSVVGWRDGQLIEIHPPDKNHDDETFRYKANRLADAACDLLHKSENRQGSAERKLEACLYDFDPKWNTR